MREIAIHSSHRNLAELVYMHTDHKTGLIKFDEVPLQRLELYLKQNMAIVRQFDELKSLLHLALNTNDEPWFNQICNAINYMGLELTKGEGMK